MQLKTRTWALISVACFIGAAWFWQLGERKRAVLHPPPAPSAVESASPAPPAPADLVPTPATSPANGGATNATSAAAAIPPQWLLSNTDQPLDTLMRKDEALLLRNAWLDTTRPESVKIPEHLRAGGEPGAYLVQAKGSLSDAFRTELTSAGATIVSYIPNNAYLVEMSAAGAAHMSAQAGTQTVLPWEPYYKLEPDLLRLASRQEALPPGTLLNLLIFESQQGAAAQSLAQFGVEVLVQQRSPFGREWTVRAPVDTLVELARHPAVQQIEIYRERTPANDLTRPRLGVSRNSVVADNYLGLTGDGVLVNINDTGVDGTHPDLSPRVTTDSTGTFFDPDGHGTHVAGTIASSGLSGPPGQNVPGSTNNASYRGMAPMSKLFAISFNHSDEYLQTTAAGAGAFISHNSWANRGSRSYDLSSASWDAAVRDALPEQTGSQPLLAVFAAGNAGAGDPDGLGGLANTLTSPGTAKNVISVGAIEQFRNITNEIVVDMETNAVFLGSSDSTNEVASFSSRGNVGIGQEGSAGRFKPDVVAPGTWVVSTRSKDWVGPAADIDLLVSTREDEEIEAGTTNLYSRLLPDDAFAFRIQALTNAFSSGPLPILLIHVRKGLIPEPLDLVGTNDVTVPVTAGRWFYSIANTNATTVRLDVRTTISVTNTANEQITLLKELNDLVGPSYRFESGTSMSAAAISGLLALMQQHFEQTLHVTNSPALMKALLINGARTVNSKYNFHTQPPVNLQGWGLASLTNSLPLTLAGPIRFFDQETNALVTGQSQTRFVTINTNTPAALRMTLVWTDPPGNPSAGIKLVNDLDLIVTNLDNGQVFVGNNIQSSSLFNDSSATNAALVTDLVNNVENVYLSPPLGSNYSVTVRARRVNVNAVTAHPDGIAQDYALVISYGTNNFTVSAQPPPLIMNPVMNVVTVSSGIPLLRQRVGANTPLLVSPNGVTNQWNFYVFQNSVVTNGIFATNVAFVTFLPPNLSRPRFDEADIDLYVSTDPALTNLGAIALATAWKSTGRGGTESIVRTDATPDQVYYVGVKSEDQQGATFGFFAISSIESFGTRDGEGNLILRAQPAPMIIPDGNPANPGLALMFAFATEEITVESVIVTNVVFHELGGDLQGVLSHDSVDVVLNNHREFQGLFEFIYDDSDSGEILQSQFSDGPGSLRDFVGEQGVGVWQFTMIDNSLQHTGVVQSLLLKLVPRNEETNGTINVTATILPNRFFFTVVDVPADATNLQVCASVEDGPVELFIRREEFPDRTLFDAFATIVPPGSCLNLSVNDSPPLSQGRYFIGVFNPNFQTLTVNLAIRVQRDLDRRIETKFSAANELGLLDDARTNSVIFVTNQNVIADVKVGVRIDHDRLSDLVLHLVSPTGTRLLLTENRGRLEADRYGSGIFITNVFPATSSGGALADTNVIGTTINQGTLIINYQFFTVPDQLQVYYEGSLLFDSGVISGGGTFTVEYGPGSTTNVVIVMNPGNNNDLGTLWTYQASVVSGGFLYTTFTDDPRLSTQPIKFATPPFALTNTSFSNLTVTPISDFELEAPGTVVPGIMVDGWDIFDHPVSVLDTPGEAAGGDNYLALIDGRIRRVLPTIAGRPYRLSYAARNQCIVGWWPAENSNENVISGLSALRLGGVTFTDSTNGYVQRAFNFPTNSTPRVFAPATPGLNVGLGPGLTIELWINPLNLNSAPLVAWSDNVRDGVQLWQGVGGPGTLYVDLVDTNGVIHALASGRSSPITTNQWQHIAMTFDRTSGRTIIYHNGLRVVDTVFAGITPQTSYPVLMGGLTTQQSFFRGKMDEISIYGCELSPAEIQAIYRAGRAGKANALRRLPAAFLDMNGDLREVLPGPDWATQSFIFYSPSNNTSIDIVGLSPLSVLLDEFVLTEALGDIYYQPEESLTPLRGENSYGPWTLEIWDTRVGGAVTNQTLISWELQLTFVHTNPPTILLTNGSCYAGMLYGAERLFFQVQVPATAGSVTNTLTSLVTNLNLVFNQSGLPFTNAAGNIDLLLNETGSAVITTFGTFLSDTNGMLTGVAKPPDLIPGQRYYLALQNTDVTQTNDFNLCINFGLAPPDPGTIVQLTNGVPVTNVISALPASGGGGTVPSGQLQYYEYVASPNASAVIFEILSQNGNVDLFVRHGLPLPTTVSYDYASRMTGTNTEYIAVTNFAAGALSGSWFIGVANFDSVPVTYALLAREVTFDCVALTNGVAYTPPEPVVALGTAYYCYEVSSNAFAADFELFPVDGNVDLYLSKVVPPLPSPTTFAYRSVRLDITNEFIRVTNTASINPLTPGTWYMAVVNKETFAVNYSVRVTEDTNLPPNIIVLTNDIPYASGVDVGELDFYKFRVSPGALQVNFELLAMTGNADLYVKRGLPLPIPGSSTFQSTNPGQANDWIILTSRSRPERLVPGDYFLAVANNDSTNVEYTVRVTEFVRNTPQLEVLMDSITYTNIVSTNSVATRATDYYVIDVPILAVQARFEILGGRGDVDLYVNHAVPLPGPTNFAYASTRVGAVESITVTDDSPVSLSGGEWFVSVVNKSFIPVDYQLRVTLWSIPEDIVRLTNNVAYSNTVNVAGVPEVDDVDYYVFTVSTDGVQAQFETFDASGNVDLYVRRGLPLPNPTSFDTNSVHGGTTNELIQLVTGGVPVALTAGEWYLAVVNREPVPVSYHVRATEIRLGTEVRVLTSFAVVNDCLEAAGGPLDTEISYYVFNVSSDALQFVLETTQVGQGGNADVFLRKGLPVPNADMFDTASTNAASSDEMFLLTTNSLPVALSPGAWFIAVQNRDTSTQACYSIRAVEWRSSRITRLTNAVPYKALVGLSESPPGIQYYRYNVSSNAIEVAFETFDATGNVDLFIGRGLPLPDTMNFDHASTNAGVSDEMIVLSPATPSLLLQPGDWYLAVANRESTNVFFTVMATEYAPQNIELTRLTNGVPHTNAVEGAAGGSGRAAIDYYVYTVSSNAVEARFQLRNLSGDVDLYVRKGTPLPGPGTYDFQSTNRGAANEFIKVLDSSTPVPLTPGDWYLAVVNKTLLPLDYTVVASDFAMPVTDLVITAWRMTNSSFCITWTSVPGESYYVEGKANLLSPGWAPVSPAIVAAESSTTYCLTLPSPYAIFEVRQGTPSSSPITNLRGSIMTGIGFLLQWRSSTNLEFGVEWSPLVPTNHWNSFSDVITSSDGEFRFLDDGSQTGGLGAQRFYRVFER